jgi:phosphoglycolate phosphatase
MSRPSAVLFDWDLTLVDTVDAIHAALNAARASAGLEPWDRETAKSHMRFSLVQYFPEVFGEAWPAARDVFYRHFAATHLDLVKPMPGAGGLLEAVSRLGIPMAVVSNKRGDMLRAEAGRLGWTPYFTRIVGAGDAAADKPDPAVVDLALSGLAAARSGVWFVGDTDVDMLCARNSGCVPVLVGGTDLPDCPALERKLTNI